MTLYIHMITEIHYALFSVGACRPQKQSLPTSNTPNSLNAMDMNFIQLRLLSVKISLLLFLMIDISKPIIYKEMGFLALDKDCTLECWLEFGCSNQWCTLLENP